MGHNCTANWDSQGEAEEIMDAEERLELEFDLSVPSLQVDADDVITKEEQIFLLLKAKAKCERHLKAKVPKVHGECSQITGLELEFAPLLLLLLPALPLSPTCWEQGGKEALGASQRIGFPGQSMGRRFQCEVLESKAVLDLFKACPRLVLLQNSKG